MTDIFISHSGDHGLVRVLVEKLEARGFTVWWDENLEPGTEWAPVIDQKIVEAKAIIVVMTKEAYESKYVTYEWSFALGLGKRVIVLEYRETPYHPRLERLHHLDLRRPGNDDWDKLYKALDNAVKPEVRHPLIDAIAELLHLQKLTQRDLNIFILHDALSEAEIQRIMAKIRT